MVLDSVQASDREQTIPAGCRPVGRKFRRSDAIDAEEAAAQASKSYDTLNESFDAGKISAAEYDRELKALIATTNDPAIKKQLEGKEREAHDKARHVGEALAIIVAETRDQAEDARLFQDLGMRPMGMTVAPKTEAAC